MILQVYDCVTTRAAGTWAREHVYAGGLPSLRDLAQQLLHHRGGRGRAREDSVHRLALTLSQCTAQLLAQRGHYFGPHAGAAAPLQALGPDVDLMLLDLLDQFGYPFAFGGHSANYRREPSLIVVHAQLKCARNLPAEPV